MRVKEHLESLRQDLRYAARGLARRPGFTAVAVLTLAIGIGGTTAIYSAVNALLWRRLPYVAPEQLMAVSLTMPAVGGVPGEKPLGKRVGVGQDPVENAAEVVGIVGGVRQFLDSLPKPEVYLHYAQSPGEQMTIFVRAEGAPLGLVSGVRRAVREFAPQYPVHDVQAMTTRTAGAAAQTRFSTVLLGLFAATALSLAVVGIYGVMALAVTARTREMGIRIALGADEHRVKRQVVYEGLVLVSAGVTLGLAGAFACTRVLQKLLFDLSPTDPVTYLAAVVLLGVAAVVASWVPARRASSVDPMVALRAD